MELGPEHQQFNVHTYWAQKAPSLLKSVHQQVYTNWQLNIVSSSSCCACANACPVGILRLGPTGHSTSQTWQEALETACRRRFVPTLLMS